MLRVKAPVRARLFASNYHFKARCSWFQVVKRDLPYVRQAIGRSNFRSFPVYKVEHSGKEATRLGRNSNNSNTDVIFRKDNISPLRGSGFGHSAFLQIRRSEFAKKLEGEKNCG